MHKVLFHALLPVLLATLSWILLAVAGAWLLVGLWGTGVTGTWRILGLVLAVIGFVVVILHRVPQGMELVDNAVERMTLHLLPSHISRWGEALSKELPEELTSYRSQWRFVSAFDRLTPAQEEIRHTLQNDPNNTQSRMENVETARLLSPEKGKRAPTRFREVEFNYARYDFVDRYLGDINAALVGSAAVALTLAGVFLPIMVESINRPEDQTRIQATVLESAGLSSEEIIVELEDGTHTLVEYSDSKPGDVLNLYVQEDNYSESTFQRAPFHAGDVILLLGMSVTFGTALVAGVAGLLGTVACWALPRTRRALVFLSEQSWGRARA